MGISFCTPVKWEDSSSGIEPTITCCQKIAQAAENYLYLGRHVAVAMPNSARDESHLVTLKEQKAHVWLTALKVASYFTVILPLLALIIKIIFRSNYQFHHTIAIIPKAPLYPPQSLHLIHNDKTCPYRYSRPAYRYTRPVCDSPIDEQMDDEPGTEAPLTLVRSPEQTSLKISVLFNKKFSPVDPTEPKPSSIINLKDVLQTSKHTWQVMTQGDGTLAMQDGGPKKINMIWWEAQRQEAPKLPQANVHACIKRNDVADFLEQVLRKQGVKEQEMDAFIYYWQTVLANNYKATSPYLLVRQIDLADINDYLPEMQVEGDKAKDYAINRFYFRFEPIAQPSTDYISANEYLERLAVQSLGERAIIDLGGEVKAPSIWRGKDAFNTAFINKYIYAS